VRIALKTAPSLPAIASWNPRIADRTAGGSPLFIVSDEKPPYRISHRKSKMLFNIHNPSQDHRDRGACAFLLTP